MKTLGKLKLNKLSNAELDAKKMRAIMGGKSNSCSCGCSCLHEGHLETGPQTFDNAEANTLDMGLYADPYWGGGSSDNYQMCFEWYAGGGNPSQVQSK